MTSGVPPTALPPIPGDDAARVVRWTAYAAPDRIALEWGAKRISYGELDEQSDRLAQSLLDELAAADG